jgi:hypothetical protein
MLRIRKFTDWQNNALSKIQNTRKARIKAGEAHPDSLGHAVSLQTISVSTVLDGNFVAFANIVGGSVAETYFIRTLQFVANGYALTGDVPIARDKFGPVVLTRGHDIVSPAKGAKVYDALLRSGIALPLVTTDADTHAVTARVTACDTDCESTRARSLPDPALPDPSPPVPAVADGGSFGPTLTTREKRRFLAGCGALAIDDDAGAGDRAKAREMFTLIREGKVSREDALDFEPVIHRYENSRIAFLSTGKEAS